MDDSDLNLFLTRNSHQLKILKNKFYYLIFYRTGFNEVIFPTSWMFNGQVEQSK
jgi:hypothetical protein